VFGGVVIILKTHMSEVARRCGWGKLCG